jgi:leucyl-tRNA synthetase
MYHGENVLMILDQNTNEVRYFSRNLMCPTSGISYQNPEPNLFSFNSPKGACEVCKGLGTVHEINLKKIIPNPKLSIKNGGFAPLGEYKSSWIFKQLFDCYYDNATNKAERISKLIATFETEGNANVNACSDCETIFNAEEWNAFSTKEKEMILQEYRMAYLADSWVNWCPALGTVLANDEVVNGVSERGGHPVVQKLMRQWSMRIKAYAERLLQGLETVDWTDSIKEQQRNWIGKSQGCSVKFEIANYELLIANSGNPQSAATNPQSAINNPQSSIEVFTTRPDTIFGVSFMVLAPELDLVQAITTEEQRSEVEAYIKAASLKSERDRQSDVKNISGAFTGAYAVHPFTGEQIPIWIGDYVLASYGTGAVMAVPCGDQRDWDFAKHFNLPIKNIFADTDISEAAYAEKDAIIANSDFLNGLDCKTAMKKAIEIIESKGLGKGKTNYRLRDAVFSRQRYWGEPFPVYYKDELPYLVDDQHLPIELPEVDKYLPTEDGEPPLARAEKSAWNYTEGDRMEFNTMPGWAGSSWYFLRYMDPKNENEFVSKEKVDYWKNVDLYIGGSEHATGHLLYARFWTKFLCDLGFIGFDEPFQKMINQGMILGRSSLVYRVQYKTDFRNPDNIKSLFVSKSLYNDLNDSQSTFRQSAKETIINFIAKINKLGTSEINSNLISNALYLGSSLFISNV